jgi:Auxiliary Activity family 9 (formerly GH61)
MIGVKNATFTIPASLPAGDYLMRIEHIGLYVAQSLGAAQFYISCGQLTVTGRGAGSPSPLVAFPGAYSATDPGIMINIFSAPLVNIPPKQKGWRTLEDESG